MMTTTVEELEHWMNVPEEYENLEFKEAKSGFHSERVLKYCVALSNEGGGKLILGVTNERPRKVVGTQAANYPPGTQKKILDTLHFLVRVEQVKHPDGRVVIFHIPTRDRGTARQHEGAYWMRSGEELKPMTPERLREIFDEGGPDWFMRPAREGCSAADVVRLLDTRIYFDLTKQPYPTDRDGEIARFESEKLISEDEAGYSITNLGAVLFAKRLDEFEGLGRKAPRFIVYDGPSKLKVLRDNPGTKGYVVGFQGLLEFISNQIPSNEFIGKAFRAEIFKMFPDDALRELVANALIHQDFTATGSSVMIELYSDRLEISNPGKPSISPERFIDEYRSRNEKLADLMRRLGICEERGSGIDKVVSSAEFYQLPAPDFRVSEQHTIAVMFAYKAFDEMEGKDRVRSCYQHCVLRYVTNQRMTNQSLRERFHLPESKVETVSRIIGDAIQQRKIKPDDPSNTSRRYARYVPWWA